MRTISFGRWIECFKYIFNPVTLTSSGVQEVHLGKEKSFEVFLAVKTLKAASCEEIQTEMLKTLNKEVFG